MIYGLSCSPHITQLTLFKMTPLSLKLTIVGTLFRITFHTKLCRSDNLYSPRALKELFFFIYRAYALQHFICWLNSVYHIFPIIPHPNVASSSNKSFAINFFTECFNLRPLPSKLISSPRQISFPSIIVPFPTFTYCLVFVIAYRVSLLKWSILRPFVFPIKNSTYWTYFPSHILFKPFFFLPRSTNIS